MGIENYEIQECVGKGTFGDVYKAISLKDRQLVAVKVINLDSTTEDINDLIQEIQFLSRLRTQYITKYLETFSHGTSMWIVMEYCGGGSCADLLKCHKKLSEEVTAYIIRDVLRGLCYLQGEKKVHRDIKLANILLTKDGKIKLADFGVSGEITMTHLKRNTFVGTPFWMAPEVISRQKPGYNEKADIWSTGITTIELVTGSPPLSDHNPLKILFEIPKKKPPLLTGIDYSENIKDFVKYCLVKNPVKRPSSEALLHHKFVTNVRRHMDLGQLIKQKDAWYQQHKIVKRPNNNLNFDETDNFQMIQWNFSTTNSDHFKNYIGQAESALETTEPVRKLTPMQQTLMNSINQAYAEPHMAEPSSPGLSASMAGNMVNEIPQQQELLQTVQIVDEGNQEKPASAPMVENSVSLPRNEISSSEVLVYCLQRVKQRARYDITRDAVAGLIRDIINYEHQQPGISDAILEEILKFKYLVD